MSDSPSEGKPLISWHTIATATIGLTMAIGSIMISGWREDFIAMQSELKEIRAELVRQAGVDAGQRQQIDLNTAHLMRLDVDHREMMRVTDKMEANMDFWRSEYNWKSPKERR